MLHLLTNLCNARSAKFKHVFDGDVEIKILIAACRNKNVYTS